jgi:hypothetical protein
MEPTDNAEERHRTFLEENHARISSVARDGYREHGRGAIFIFEDGILDVMEGRAATVTIEYVADRSEALQRRGGWPTEAHALLVGDYDPDSSMVILVGRRRSGRELFTYQMLFDVDDDDTVSLSSFLG